MTISPNAHIHPTAIIAEYCEIAADVIIGPFSIVEYGVVIGKGTIIGSHCLIKGNTHIGENNKIFSHVCIGEITQNQIDHGEDTQVIIGNNNTIREGVTIHRGSFQYNGKTIIGDNNLLMVKCHIEHDCNIGNNCILSNSVILGPKVTIHDFAFLGNLTSVHQDCVIGTHVMVSDGSSVAQDIPPFITAQGNHAKAFGLNSEGIHRRSFEPETKKVILQAYDLIYKQNLSPKEIKETIYQYSQTEIILSFFVRFFEESKRGIISSVNINHK